MRLSWNDIRARAASFARAWEGACYEKGETQTFYNEFFEIFGVKRRKVATFEEPVRQLAANRRGYIDLFWKGTLLVEQKSLGRDLVKAKQQALAYFPGLKEDDLPQYVLVCDFQNFELYDLDSGEEIRFKLAELPRHVRAFSFINGAKKREFKDQDPVNIVASELMGALHDALLASGYGGHDLERLLVRLVFCLFADDTGIFQPKDIFLDYIRDRTSDDGSDLGPKLAQLFEVLNTPPERRQTTLDEDLTQFPYVNGDLFAERLAMPAFDRDMRQKLFEAAGFHWETISPAIFGALFQSVMNKQRRRAIGAHYTTEQNILKVIGPLFLDELRSEFERICTYQPNRRPAALRAFQEKLAAIKCFDPACGCGNFLVIAYRELRELETRVLLELSQQRELDVSLLSKVNVDQFYGIELEEFPARIAEVAMWMTDHIMNVRLSDELGEYFARIPLKAAPTIVHSDALDVDWADILPPEQCSYVLGNPPFIGAKYQSDEQRAQIHRIAALGGRKGSLDYVTGWFLKAAAYARAGGSAVGFVSTNSITQGEQVGELWPLLFRRHRITISFAHRTFAWGSEARGRANVHVIILGLARAEDAPATRRLFDYPDIRGNPVEVRVRAISPYLFDASSLSDPERVVREAPRPLTPRPAMLIGSKPIDGGHFIFASTAERDAFIAEEPGAASLIRPYVGSAEFLNGGDRFILALQGVSPERLRDLPLTRQRIEAVRDFRAASASAPTRKLAQTPAMYHVNVLPDGPYLVIPKVSSERRDYVPIGWLEPPVVPSDLVFIVQNATLPIFAVMTSRMHMAWLRSVAGRLKSDYRYSIGLTYNPFPLPHLDSSSEDLLARLAQNILDERAQWPGAALADLYDPTRTPVGLLRAHHAVDRAVDRLYRREPFDTDRARVEYLFKQYEQLVAPVEALAATRVRPPRAARSSVVDDGVELKGAA